MALKFKGEVAALPDTANINDAYLLAGTGYKYCSALSGTTPTWTSYDPIKIVDNLALSIVYEGNGAPTASTNAVQFPTLETGAFYLDGTTGDVWAYVTGTTGWQKW